MAGAPTGKPSSSPAGAASDAQSARLPASLVFVERDWLSSNHLIGFNGDAGASRHAVIVDTGYGSRSALTQALVERALAGTPLRRIINTHAHSDHVGGNAALQLSHRCRIQVPEGAVVALRDNDDHLLHYASMGQHCPRFVPDEGYGPGDRLRIGDLDWRALGSPGHDNDSLVLYEPTHRLLLSGDALWQNGFGLLFPVFFDEPAFDQQAETLDELSTLAIDLVIPGHGPLFGDAAQAIDVARRKLAYLRAHPERHGWLALKVALSFILLDRRAMALDRLAGDFAGLDLVERINARYFGLDREVLAARVRDELVAGGVARIEGERLLAATSQEA